MLFVWNSECYSHDIQNSQHHSICVTFKLLTWLTLSVHSSCNLTNLNISHAHTSLTCSSRTSLWKCHCWTQPRMITCVITWLWQSSFFPARNRIVNRGIKFFEKSEKNYLSDAGSAEAGFDVEVWRSVWKSLSVVFFAAGTAGHNSEASRKAGFANTIANLSKKRWAVFLGRKKRG